MKNEPSHPARSPEFLSRLHDGELTAAERAHFESHRSHCADCRDAATQFETALSLYRSTSTSLPSRDLAARILRRLDSVKSRRPPLGIVFGIDVRWAGAFAAALLAVLVGSSIVAERDAARRAAAPATPISVFLPREPRVTGAVQAVPAAPAGTIRDTGRHDAALMRQRSAANIPSSSPDAPAPVPPGQPEPETAAAERQSVEVKGELAPQSFRAAKPAQASSPMAAAPERVGGEGTGSAASVIVLALDGEGSAPAILTHDAKTLLTSERGRQYEILVESSGRVRDARLASASRRFAAEPTARAAGRTSPVWSLKFAPGDRPRRLLLRIE